MIEIKKYIELNYPDYNDKESLIRKSNILCNREPCLEIEEAVNLIVHNFLRVERWI